MEAAYRADAAEVGARRPVGVGAHHAVVSAHDGLEGTVHAGNDRLFGDVHAVEPSHVRGSLRSPNAVVQCEQSKSAP